MVVPQKEVAEGREVVFLLHCRVWLIRKRKSLRCVVSDPYVADSWKSYNSIFSVTLMQIVFNLCFSEEEIEA